MKGWPLYEVFIRPRNGIAHRHVGSVHAPDAEMALELARDLYCRRGEGASIWVVPAAAITASRPEEHEELFEPLEKEYRHPSHYNIPPDVKNM